jgi:uncharacterized protein
VTPAAPQQGEFSLAAKVAALREAQTYAGRPGAVDAVETHMSWVFLTGQFAYKLKKPVAYEYLDFRDLAARRHFCDEEVRLNAALAPGVYLGVTALTREPGGELRVDGRGEPVEWLVRMRRLPAGRMLDVLIRKSAVTPEDIRGVADALAAFYRGSVAVETDGVAYRNRLEQRIRANERVLGDPAFGPDVAAVADVNLRLRALLEQMPRMFEQRATGGHIVDGLGDLRPEHICLESSPVIFDRLEFNSEFRIADAVDELAALSMECERLGAGFAEKELFGRYEFLTADRAAPALKHFYAAYRACVRARLAILHTRELARPAWAHWQVLAGDYLRLAQAHAGCLPVQPCSSSVREPPV